MADFFIPLGAGIYRSGSRHLETAEDGAAWTRAYDVLLEKTISWS